MRVPTGFLKPNLFSPDPPSVFHEQKKRHEEENISTRTKGGATKSRNAIIITELPYMTNKSGLLEKLADLVNDKKIDGIADLRDESDRDGIRVVIELKRDAVAAVVTVSEEFI